ncbi:MAG: DNA repair protein RadA [Bacteroidales bacterium]|nr:DNA repair protein RadA [Bacteroidales bacterium]
MLKTKTIWVCQNCGVESSKWIGRCPSCGEWNTYVEEIVRKDSAGKTTNYTFTGTAKPITLQEIASLEESRIDTRSIELNRILGGGIVPGSIILLGGEPGIGKSTLALQLALGLKELKILYVSGEESNSQIKLRASRIKSNHENCYILTETSLENVLTQIENTKAGLVIVDSIQTMFTENISSTPGSISQIRECTVRLLKYAKETAIPVLLIGHITKEGNLAGPKALEHIVDVVLQFEGDQNHLYRILRATKNRFGSTSELGIYEMRSNGLREVHNPSELLISHIDENLSGVSISATIDGIRPFLIETQALVSSAVYGTPQRSSTGFDLRRLNMLLAVLEKRAGFRLVAKDVFLNIAGGIKVNDPAIDLAVISAVLSSNIDVPINKRICFAGEVGLSGEIRPVNRVEQRIREAEKLGFSEMYISKYNRKGLDSSKFNIKIHFQSRIEDLIKNIFKP